MLSGDRDGPHNIIGSGGVNFSWKPPKRTKAVHASGGVRTFGSTELAARFDNGVLVEADQTLDSELVQIAKVPFDAVKALGSAVSEVLRIRIDQTSQETELSEKELALLEANQALADALEEAGGNSNDEND